MEMLILWYYEWSCICICCQLDDTSGNHASFGFCNDSVNSLNSVKFI